MVHPLLLLAGLADQSHALCNVQIDAQNVDGFLTENAKQLALRVISHNLFQLLLAQAGGFSQSRNLDLCRLWRDMRIQPGAGGCHHIGGDVLASDAGIGVQKRFNIRLYTFHKGRVGEVYNVGGHNERTNLEVVKTILRALNKPESLIRFVTDRPGHDRRYAIDPTKLETELGWKPKYTFDTGIEQTIDWYLNNREWWEHIISGEYANYFDKMYGERL